MSPAVQITRPNVAATRTQDAVRIRSDMRWSSLARCSTTQTSRVCCAPHVTSRPPIRRSSLPILQVFGGGLRNLVGDCHGTSLRHARIGLLAKTVTRFYSERAAQSWWSWSIVPSPVSAATGTAHASPRHASMPSLIAQPAMTRAATESAQLHPRSVLSRRPSRSAADR